MYCGTVSLIGVAPFVSVWMRVGSERLAGKRKDSEASRAADVRPNWPARGRFSGDPAIKCANAYLKASQRRNRDARYIVQKQSPRQIRPPDRQAGATNSEATSTTKATEPARRRRYEIGSVALPGFLRRLHRHPDGGSLRAGRASGGLYQRTVFIFWKPLLRNPCLEFGRTLQFRERSPPALGNLGKITNAWLGSGSRSSQRRSVWR